MTKVPGDRAASRSWPPRSPALSPARGCARAPRWQHADDQLAAAHRFPGIPGGNAASLDGPAPGSRAPDQTPASCAPPWPGWRPWGPMLPSPINPILVMVCSLCDPASAGRKGCPLGPAIEGIQPGLARLRGLPARGFVLVDEQSPHPFHEVPLSTQLTERVSSSANTSARDWRRACQNWRQRMARLMGLPRRQVSRPESAPVHPARRPRGVPAPLCRERPANSASMRAWWGSSTGGAMPDQGPPANR